MAATNGWHEIKQLLVPGGLPELGPGPRAGVLSEKALGQAIKPAIEKSGLPATSRELIRGLLLLWHDHLDAAHGIGQGIESADGSFLHGIVHRREPDFSNAAYWFRRVRGHASYPVIAKRVTDLLTTSDEHPLLAGIVPQGQWDPIAFIRCCERVEVKPATHPQVDVLRKVQGVEFEVLLGHWMGA